MQLEWSLDEYGNYVARVGDYITLCASPVHTVTRQFKTRAKRGTKWRAQVSIWDGKSTISRYGRDAYHELHDTAADAMRLAEVIYGEARKENNL